MTNHDKARELVVRLRGLEVCYLYAEEAADLIASLAEENQRLRKVIRQADDILEDRGFAIESGARLVMRIALSSGEGRHD